LVKLENPSDPGSQTQYIYISLKTSFLRGGAKTNYPARGNNFSTAGFFHSQLWQKPSVLCIHTYIYIHGSRKTWAGEIWKYPQYVIDGATCPAWQVGVVAPWFPLLLLWPSFLSILYELPPRPSSASFLFVLLV
jgi:hypothetical protein